MKRFADELHHRALHHYPRRHVDVVVKNDTWSADLVDMSEFADVNDNIRFLLTMIDLGTRYAWARPIKNKTGTEIKKALQSIFDDAHSTPKKLWTDQGSE